MTFNPEHIKCLIPEFTVFENASMIMIMVCFLSGFRNTHVLYFLGHPGLLERTEGMKLRTLNTLGLVCDAVCAAVARKCKYKHANQ